MLPVSVQDSTVLTLQRHLEPHTPFLALANSGFF